MKDKHRRASMRTRLRPEDVTSWVVHNQTNYSPAAVPTVTFPEQPANEDIESSSDEDSENSSLTEKPRYLDGGYAWVIALYSFCLHFILDGLSFSFGVIFPEIQKQFETIRTGASATASFFLSFPLLFAPVAGAFTDIFGCRFTILTGGIICLICGIGSIFCTSIMSFSLVFGCGCGIGMCFVYNAAIVVVTYYFDKKRGIATSIAVSGTGCGTAVFPFFLGVFDNIIKPKLKSSMVAINLAFGAIVVIGCVIKDVTWLSDTTEFKERKFNRRVRQMREEQQAMEAKNDTTLIRQAISMPSIPMALWNRLRKESSSMQNVNEAVTVADGPSRSRSVGTFIRRGTLPKIPEYSMLVNTQLEHLEHLDLEVTNSPCTTVKSQARERMTSKNSMSVDCINEEGAVDYRIGLPVKFSNSTSSEEKEDDGSSSTDDSDVSNDGDSSSSELTEKVLQKPSNHTNLVSPTSPTNPLAFAISSAPNTARTNRTSLAPGVAGITAGRVMAGNALQPRALWNTNLLAIQGKVPSAPILAVRKKRRNLLHRLNIHSAARFVSSEAEMYKQLWIRRPLISFLVSVFCLYLVLDVPYVYFVDYVTENLGFSSEQSLWMTSSIGIANVITINLYGYLCDRSWLKERLFMMYGVVLIIVSLSLILAAFVETYFGFLVLSIMYGGSVSANYAMQSILLTVIFEEMSCFQGAYSISNFVEGIATLAGPLIIGAIRDLYGTYTHVFIACGIITFISSASAFYTHVLLKKELAEEEEEECEKEKLNEDKKIKSNLNGSKNAFRWRRDMGRLMRAKWSLNAKRVVKYWASSSSCFSQLFDNEWKRLRHWYEKL